MYRLLEIGEVIESGDEWYDEGAWRANNVVGLLYVVDIPLRRLVKPAVTPAAESVKPVQVVSVGDRVKVLTGPWAGCTGVVTLLDKWNQWNTDVSVMLDNVHVGGCRLGLVSPVSQVEPLPPVVPEVLFRDLVIGEVIRQGDEFWAFGYGPWASVGPAEIGGTINTFKARHRRPVRVQSPGWRYLDAGETVQAGDETPVEILGWRRLPITNGMTVGNEKLFRRKLPANVGG